MDIISPTELINHIGAATVGDQADRIPQLATQVNELITEKWRTPVDPIPVSVKILALDIAARGFGSTPGRARLESFTRSADNTSRTERYTSAGGAEAAKGRSVFITDDELLQLNPRRRRRARTIRTHVPGTSL